MTLNAVIAGNFQKAAPLVLLHGFGGGAVSWDGIAASLQGDHPVIAYDLPGHGASLDSDSIGGAGRMAKAILADLDHRGVGHFHLAGHSLGGAVAALLALRNPERVASLALLAPGGFGPAINHRALHRFAVAETEATLAAALEPMVGFNAVFPPEPVAKMLADRRRPGAMAAMETIFAAMFVDARAEQKKQGRLPTDALSTLKMPIRLLWGEEDNILPVVQTEDLPANVLVWRLPEAGHMLIEECAEDVLAAIHANLDDAF